jgi:hypothetical protein
MAKAKFKSKRYDEGGVTEGQNSGIDDDTRARAMKYVQEQSEKGSEDESSGEKTVSRSTSAKVSTKPASVKAAKADTETSNKADARDAEAGTSRGRPAEGEPKGTMGANPPRARTRAESIAAIPTGGKAGAGPTPGNGNSVEGSELSRNVKNTLMAMGPTRLAGLGNAAVEGAMTARAAGQAGKAVKAAEETTKAVKSAKSAAQTARAAREAKTLNPNAWMAGPKGMKDNFKSGGGVKGWGIARGSRAAKTY